MVIIINIKPKTKEKQHRIIGQISETILKIEMQQSLASIITKAGVILAPTASTSIDAHIVSKWAMES